MMIPLAKIVGSVGRYKDFTRDFLPRNAALGDRWIRIEQQMEKLEGLPPIEVYKIGDVYFVADGNHRVSVARANGFDEIEAYVTELPLDPQIGPGDSLDAAILKAERVRFLADTGLDQRVPHLDIYFTKPGGFPQLLAHIETHRRTQATRQPNAPPMSLPDAALDWYERTYEPIIAAIRDRRLLERFPSRTAADLYVWIWNTVVELYRIYGEQVSPDEAAALLELRAPSPLRQAVGELMTRLAQVSHVFGRPEDQPPAWATRTYDWDDLAFAPAWEENGA
jgi:hypothetical protein